MKQKRYTLRDIIRLAAEFSMTETYQKTDMPLYDFTNYVKEKEQEENKAGEQAGI